MSKFNDSERFLQWSEKLNYMNVETFLHLKVGMIAKISAIIEERLIKKIKESREEIKETEKLKIIE